jgi:hypothetical protein
LKEILSLTKKKMSKKKKVQEAPKTKANPRAGQRAAASPVSSTKSSQRIPHGFSFKRGSEQNRMGPTPTCRGCKKPITSRESKIIHKHKQDAGHKYNDIH